MRLPLPSLQLPKTGSWGGAQPAIGSSGITLGNRVYWDRTMSHGGFLKSWYLQIVNFAAMGFSGIFPYVPPMNVPYHVKCKQPDKSASCSKEALGK